MTQSLVIAIDGPSGSGKSTTARLLANELLLGYLDTGAMYRAVAWEYLRKAGTMEAADAIVEITRAADLRISTHPDAPRVTINGHDVTAAIREPQVSASVSVVATNTDVRRILTKKMREIIAAHHHRIVVEGRDITTVVAPDADVRILLVADPEARVARRAAELGRASTSAPSPTRSSVVTATTPRCPTSLTPPRVSSSSTPPASHRSRWWSRSCGWSRHCLLSADWTAVLPQRSASWHAGCMTELDVLVFYVPVAETDAVLSALFAAGAGRIGDYDQCAFVLEGRGQFRP